MREIEEKITRRARDIVDEVIRTAPEKSRRLIQMNPGLGNMLRVAATWSADEAIRMMAEDKVETTK